MRHQFLRGSYGGGGGGGGTPWTPAAISTELWLDPSDPSTLTHTAGEVTEWRDKSGNAWVFTPVGPGPTFNEAEQRVEFVPTRVVRAAADQYTGTNFLYVLVVLPTTSSLARGAVDTAPSTANTFRTSPFSGDARWELWNDAPVVNMAGAQNAIGVHAIDIRLAPSRSVDYRYNGANLGTYTDVSTVPVAWNRMAIGAINTTAAPLSGYIYSTLILDASVVTADIIQRIEGWAAHKYSFSADLDPAHPYRNSPPTI